MRTAELEMDSEILEVYESEKIGPHLKPWARIGSLKQELEIRGKSPFMVPKNHRGPYRKTWKCHIFIRNAMQWGFGSRPIAMMCGLSKKCIMRHKRLILSKGPLFCECGKPVGHPEWCKARLRLSKKRRAYLNLFKRARRLAIMHPDLERERRRLK